MQSVSAELAAAITAPERTIRPVLTVDWLQDGHSTGHGTLDDLSGMVSSVKRDQKITTDLPGAVKLVRGSAVAQLDATLSRGAPTWDVGDVLFLCVASFQTNTVIASTLNLTAFVPQTGDYLLCIATVQSDQYGFELGDSGPFQGGNGIFTPDFEERRPFETEPWVPLAEAVMPGVGRTRVWGRRFRAGDSHIFPFSIGEFSDPGAALSAMVYAVRPKDATKSGITGVRAAELSAELFNTSIHTTPPVTVTSQRNVLVSFFSAVGTIGRWTGFTDRVNQITDDFTRGAVGSSWGAPTVNLTVSSPVDWSLSLAAAFSTNGTQGQIFSSVVGDPKIATIGPIVNHARVRASISTDKLAVTATISTGVVLLYTDANNYYRCIARLNPGGAVDAFITKVSGGVASTVASSLALAGLTHQVGVALNIAAERHRSDSLKLKIWQGTEPDTWSVVGADSEFTSGVSGIFARTDTGYTGGATTFTVDDVFISYSLQGPRNNTDESAWVGIQASDIVGPGTYTRTANTSTATLKATMGIVALQISDAGDETTHPAWLFSPVNKGSPYYSLPHITRDVNFGMEFQTAAGAQTVQRMKGRIRGMNVSGKTRRVEIAALDYREFFRKPLYIPTTDGQTDGLNASWLVDWIMAECGFYTCPYYRAYFRTLRAANGIDFLSFSQVRYWSMHGSLRQSDGEAFDTTPLRSVQLPPFHIMQRATGGTVAQIRPEFVRGRYVLGTGCRIGGTNDYTRVFTPEPATSPGSISGFHGTSRVDFQIRGDDFPSAATQNEIMYLQLTSSRTTFGDGVDGFLYLGVWRDRRLFARLMYNGVQIFQAFGPTLPADGQWRGCGITFDFDSATQKVYFSMEGVGTSNTTVVVNFPTEFPKRYDNERILSYFPISDVLFSLPGSAAEASGTPYIHDFAFTASAYVDTSLLELDVSADGNLREAWDILQEFAGAEQAVVYLDEFGASQYRTRARLSAPNAATVQATVTAEGSITDLDIRTEVDTVRNRVTLPYQPVLTPLTALQQVFENTSVGLLVPPGQSRTFALTFSAPVNQAYMTGFGYYSGVPFTPATYVGINTASDGSGTWLSFSDNVDASIIGPSTCAGTTWFFTNSRSTDVYVVRVGVAGMAFRPQQQLLAEATTDIFSTEEDIYGAQLLALSSNQWVQQLAVAQVVVDAIRQELSQPQTVITRMKVRGDPRLQLNDRIKVQDQYGIVLDGEYWITGITDDYSGSGYSMDLDCREAVPVATWDDTSAALLEGMGRAINTQQIDEWSLHQQPQGMSGSAELETATVHYFFGDEAASAHGALWNSLWGE